jgi:hypothetical protein
MLCVPSRLIFKRPISLIGNVGLHLTASPMRQDFVLITFYAVNNFYQINQHQGNMQITLITLSLSFELIPMMASKS